MSKSTDSKTTPQPLALSQPLPLIEHPAAVYLSLLSAGSRRTMQTALDAIASLLTNDTCDALTLDWSALRYKHTAAVRAALENKYAPTTANKMLSALRGVLKAALRLELIDVFDYTRAVDISNIKATVELRGRLLSLEEIEALLKVCFDDPTASGYRDAALIAILRGAGIRREEAIQLNVGDFDAETGALEIIESKGKKDRTVYLPPSGIPIVEDWISVRGLEDGPLLCHVNKGGRIVRRRLTPQAVKCILDKRATEWRARGKDTGVELKPFSSHDFRRTFISELLDLGVDMSTVKNLAGHSDVGTTIRYDRRGEQTKRRAVQAISIPGSGRKRK